MISNSAGVPGDSSGWRQTGEREADRSTARLFRILLWSTVLLALLIRLYRLDRFSFWLDEIMQSLFIHGSWKDFWSSLRTDGFHPPLDYLIDRLGEHLRPTDAGRRLLPVAWGTMSVAALGSLVARRAGRAAALLAALFLALAPFHVRYSQEFRPYSLGVCALLVSLLCLDSWLERPGWIRLGILYLTCLATAYSLYFAAIALAMASAGLLFEDALSGPPERRRSARQFLNWSPAFVGLLWIGYLPWLPVVSEAARRAAFAPPPEMSLDRAAHVLAFYTFAPNEGYPLGTLGAFSVVLILTGVWVALLRRRLRFFVVWAIGGSAAIEALEHIHPHFFASRYFLTTAMTFPVFAGLAISSIGRRNLLRMFLAMAFSVGIVVGDVRGLTSYFRDGRPDWRPLAAFLRKQPIDERIITENGYAQLCLGYYVVGPNWLRTGPVERRSIVSVFGDAKELSRVWEPGKNAWLVLGGTRSEAVRQSTEKYPSIPFPTAEGDVTLKRLVH